ncbi:magnesium/cobalt transporter CorA [Geitlerinema sp. PCC 9228]|uniref:magnesium/cobalt transporter CorA n=1 Tax=Geitlerinema sp. PCC 9228 TaxID=111611 RepID=UPI0008F9A76E|nr:magnesium/cobalt transporter CorA [Geitlerinema sp. PCC 9228]
MYFSDKQDTFSETEPTEQTEKEEKEEKEENYFDFFYDQPGSIPGTLSIEADAAPPKMLLLEYDAQRLNRRRIETPEECQSYLESDAVTWLDVAGLGSEAILKRLGEVFQLHPLVLEDIVNVPQRPKVEVYEDRILIIAWMVMLNPEERGFFTEQVSFVVDSNYLLTVQEEPEYDCFAPVRDRIRSNKANLRKQGTDFLTYALLDAVIDGFFPVLEEYGEYIEELEEEVVNQPSQQTLEKIYQIRRELIALRRAIWPQRHAINKLIQSSQQDNRDLLSKEVQIYLRDCYDHAIQVLDLVEAYRELTSGLMDVYLSAISNKTNEIMKILAVVSTIFIPLTFVAGIYGMNFNPDASPWNMPELNWYWGYPTVLGVMAAIAGGMIYFFYRLGWFGEIDSTRQKEKLRK